MILVGINGGLRQGKSTVGAELRKLAGVDAKADLEFSYPIGQVADAWVKRWPNDVLESGLTVREIANKLIPLIIEPVKDVTGLEVDASKLLIEDTPKSLESANRLLRYLEAYIAAGPLRQEEFPQPITPENKVLHRPLYQWIGATLIENIDMPGDQDPWTHVLEQRIKTLQQREYPLVTVGGARYPLQQRMIRRNGGLMITVERPGTPEDNDITEQADARKNADIKIINNGTLDQLLVVVDTVYQDLLARDLKKEYSAV